MKIKSSIRKICKKCRFIRRYRQIRIICNNLRHKQRQR
uniref:Large ribosomal subunit protein bL36c n=1 Tax=Didymoplexis pallens TaxID=2848458 RepID=A0A976YGH2_9ASPA|nr:ribosomal protein L36 [Didymoplexis pallens]UVG41009.1 ribosomal protein L36 [Didymoplexis pallens]